MPTPSRSVRTLAAVSTAAIAVLALAFHFTTTQATHDPGAMAAMSMDMDPGASPANTATTIGSRELCARIDENDTLDADEDAVDAVQFDVTAEGIPPEAAMIAFSFIIAYDEAALSIVGADPNYLLAATPGSALLDLSDTVPDSNGNNNWIGTVADTEAVAAESGSGVLQRIMIAADAGSPAGIQWLDLEESESGHVDGTNNGHLPEVIRDGFVAINQECPLAEPSPTPRPAATPSPVPTPVGAPTPTPVPNQVIRGTVRDYLGNPVPFAEVVVSRSPDYGFVGRFYAAADGTYAAHPPPGSYILHATAGTYVGEYWTSGGGTHVADDAEPIPLSDGQVRDGIDFSLDRLPVLAGTITDSSGNPISGASVVITGPGGDLHAVTGQNGYYEVGLPELGNYLLLAYAQGYAQEYWTSTGGTPAEGAAEPISATAHNQTLVADFVLAANARLRGTVMDRAGNPLEDATVQVFAADGGWCECTVGHSDVNGAYEIVGIRPGAYRAYVYGFGYVEQYWTSTGGTRDWSSAEVVTFAADDVVEGFDFQLSRFGIIRGRVTDTGGNPLAGAWVSASTCGCSVTTDEAGGYEVWSFEAGDAIVSAGDWAHQAMYWTSGGSVPEQSAAEPISISLDQVVEGIDLALPGLARISGTVVDGEGAPVQWASVWFGPPTGGIYFGVSTGFDGTYVAYLDAGDYHVRAGAYGYADVYWTSGGSVHDQALAETISVALEETRADIDFVLPRLGSLSGRATDNHGTPIAGAWVTAYSDGCCQSGADGTDADGYYRIEGLDAGQYTVKLDDWPRPDAYWNSSGGSEDPRSAEKVAVSYGSDAAGIDFVLLRLAELSGTVTDASGNAISGAWVSLQADAPPWIDRWAHSDAMGSYRISDLPAGTYHVHASAEHYQYEYWTSTGGTQVEQVAERLTIQLDTVTDGIDFQLSRFAEVTGIVRDRHGDPVPGVLVSVGPAPCCSYWQAGIEADGSFRVTDVTPGAQFAKVSGRGIETTYWTPAGGTSDPSLAEPLSAGYDTVVENVDFVVNRLGKVSGRVTDSQGSPLAHAEVYVYTPGGSWCDSCQQGSADGDGMFTAYAPPGNYVLWAYAGDFISEFWTAAGGAPDSQNAEIITLDYESEAIADFQLGRLAVIQGSVTDNNGSPIGDFWIRADGPSFSSTWGGSSGNYGLRQLMPGDYTVSLDYNGRTVYWNSSGGSFDWSEAEPVHVDADQVLTGIDFTLPRMGTITGRVTDSNGQALPWMRVQATSLDGGHSQDVQTDLDGSYRLLVHGVPYTVRAEDPYSRVYDTIYWTSTGGTADPALAEGVPAQYDSVVAGIDFTLPERGGIAGVVTDSAGNPLQGVYVGAYKAECCGNGGAVTDVDGSFRIDHLATGSYRVSAEKDGYQYLFWTADGGTTDYQAAEGVSVQAEETTTGIDFQLLRFGTISGRVTNSAGEPVVAYVSTSGPSCCQYDITDAEGNFEIAVPGSGSYLIYAWSPQGTYLTEYWTSDGGTGRRSLAEAMTVPPETQITGIDFVLKRPGAISGTVRDNAGNAIPYASVRYSGPTCTDCSWGTNDQGQFAISYLYPGNYSLKAEHTDYQAEFWTLDGGDPMAGEEVTVAEGATAAGTDFSLNRLGSISGTVIGPDGAPVVGASIIYDSEFCDGCNGPVSDGQGNFKVDRIPPGEYVLTASAPEMTMDTATRDLAVSLAHSHGRRVRTIEVGDGEAVDGVWLRLRWSACHYDVTGDGKVNWSDVMAVARAMGSRPGRHRWNPEADVNGDGRVTGHDMKLVVKAVRSGECVGGQKHDRD